MENKKRVSDIPYMEILRKSFQLSWKNKFLWWFGLFIALGTPGSLNLNFPSGGGSNNITDGSMEAFLQSAKDFFHQYLFWIIIGVLVIFVIFLALYALGKIARGALIKSAERIDKGEAVGFKSGFAEGKKYFWKILGLDILLSLSLVVLILIVVIPPAILFFYKAFIPGTLLSLLALIFIVVLSILISFLHGYGHLYVVLADLSIWNSIEKAYALFRKNIWPSIIMSLINLVVGMAVGLLFFIAFFILIIVGVLGGLAIYVAFKWIGVIIFAAIILLIFLVAVFLFRSITEVFFQTVWFFFFKEIAAQPKVEEVVAEPVLETKIETKPSESVNMTKN